MCPPLIAAIPLIGSSLATAGTAATATAAATSGTILGMSATTAMTALSIASTAAGLYGQKQTAKAQSQLIAQQADAEREEVAQIAEEELGTRIKQARERRASALVAAGESGAMGASFAASMNQSLQNQDMDVALAAKGLKFKQRGIDDRQNMALSQLRDPSAVEAGLSIAGATARGYQQGQGFEAATQL